MSEFNVHYVLGSDADEDDSEICTCNALPRVRDVVFITVRNRYPRTWDAESRMIAGRVSRIEHHTSRNYARQQGLPHTASSIWIFLTDIEITSLNVPPCDGDAK